jgi:transglutaminase-like putative cysteine protease
VGGVLLRGDYATQRQTEAFHRWTEVWFPKVGWVPADVTLIDSASLDSYDYEFLFGLPGYSIVLSRGGIDENVLGLGYHIHRLYQGGKRERKTYVVAEPSVGNEAYPMVTLR